MDGAAAAVDDSAGGGQSRRRSRRLLTLLDALVVLVLVAAGTSFLWLRHEQQRGAPNARRVAAWAKQHGVTRIAWPDELRGVVPELLELGVTPVLVQLDGLPPAQLWVNSTAVAVTYQDSPLASVTVDELDTGLLTARLVDLGRATTVPLDPGQTVGETYARPYRYSPVESARMINSASPINVGLTLAPGTYRVAVEANDATPPMAMLQVVASLDDTATLGTASAALQIVVWEPVIMTFVVPEGGTRLVGLVISTDSPPQDPNQVIVHNWSLTRLGGGSS